MTSPALRRAIEAYESDGVSGLGAFATSDPPARAWLDDLIGAATDRRASVPATWLLHAYLQHGAELEPEQVAALLRSLDRVTEDDARLHVCQTVADLDVPKRNADQLARFLRDCAGGAHKFTRAWATDAFHRLAQQHDRYRAEALDHLDRASRDPAPSVRARARAIVRESAR